MPAAVYHIIVLCTMVIFDLIFLIGIFVARKWIVDTFMGGEDSSTYFVYAFLYFGGFILSTGLFGTYLYTFLKLLCDIFVMFYLLFEKFLPCV